MSRGGITQGVHNHLDSDDAAREMLAREVVNLRALARWLIDTHGWEVSEEAVVSALRRYDRLPAETATEQQALLGEAQLRSRSDQCAISVPRASSPRQRLVDVIDALGDTAGSRVRLLEGETRTTIIVDRTHLETVLDALGPDTAEVISDDLTELHVAYPQPEGEATPGIVGRLATILAIRDVEPAYTYAAGGEVFLLVHEGDSLRAYQALRCICSGGG